MKKASAVLENVLARITPGRTERERTEAVLRKIRAATEDAVKSAGLSYTLAGSYLRDTWLPDKKEFDIFVLFPEAVTRAELEKKGLAIGKRIVASLGGSYEIAYAEHPYVRADVGGYAVDFVPCYDIKEPGRIKSAVDRTPHHNRYILGALKEGMSSEVRLLKQFCKGIGVYGSDLCVEGFSGYLTELLIIRYGSFMSLVSSASSWEAGGVFIDLAKHHTRKPDLKEMFPAQPLVVIDPVDRKRNVAAALSPANFEKFRVSCGSFVKSPEEGYFRLGRAVLKKDAFGRLLRSRGTHVITASFRRPGVVDDVLYPQMRRTARRLSAIMEDSDFRVLGRGVYCGSGRCVLFFELEVWQLPAVRKVWGPPVFSRSHSEDFIRKYSGAGRMNVDGQEWTAEVKRQWRDVDTLMAAVLGGKTGRLRSIGIASHVASGMEKGFKLLSDGSAASLLAEEGFAAFLSEYFKSKIL